MTVISEMGLGAKILVMRFGPGTDLIKEIKETCRSRGIKYGIIHCCFGSLRKLYIRYYYPPKDPVNQPFGKDRDLELEKSFSVLSAQGMICETEDGDIDIHMHGVVRDDEGHLYGGDIREGNIVKNTMDVAVTVVSEMKLLRVWDEQTRHLQLKPVKED